VSAGRSAAAMPAHVRLAVAIADGRQRARVQIDAPVHIQCAKNAGVVWLGNDRFSKVTKGD
jgi:hypothetical protein